MDGEDTKPVLISPSKTLTPLRRWILSDVKTLTVSRDRESNPRAVLQKIGADVGEHDPLGADLGLMLPKFGVIQMHRCPQIEVRAFGHEQVGAP